MWGTANCGLSCYPSAKEVPKNILRIMAVLFWNNYKFLVLVKYSVFFSIGTSAVAIPRGNFVNGHCGSYVLVM